MNRKIRFLSLAIALIMAVIGTTSQSWADQQTRLRARRNKNINGFETELRGDYREKGGPIRLNAELEKINLPVGTRVAFCVVQGGSRALLGVGRVVKSAGIQVASIELEVTDGDFVPQVDAGNLLEAHQKAIAPFVPSPGCGSPVLLSAPFQP